LGPIVVGALFTAGAGLMLVSLVMGAGALIAATMLMLLPRELPVVQSDEPENALLSR
jgi:hypothetical protein